MTNLFSDGRIAYHPCERVEVGFAVDGYDFTSLVKNATDRIARKHGQCLLRPVIQGEEMSVRFF